MCAQTNRHTLQLALCGGGSCGGIFMWWWLYVVVEAVHGADGHMCGNAWWYYCMIVYVHDGCGL